MIFWTLVSITIILTVVAVVMSVRDCYNSLGDHLMFGFLAFIGSSVLGFFIFLACGTWMPWNNDLVADDTHHLKAIGNSNAIEGRLFFLGGGYVKDKRVLNFISQREGGAIRVEQAEAGDATIFEGANDATVQIKHYDHNNWWIASWPLGDHDEYTFRIPSGSVVESYALDNK